MELLARFEPATRFHKIFDFAEALRPLIESALRAWDEVASKISIKTKISEVGTSENFWSC